MSNRSIRVHAARLGVVAVLASAITAVALPAHADQPSEITRSSLTSTDSARPHASIPLAAVGTHVDKQGVSHTSRAYATFDLSAMAGRRVSSSYLVISGATTNACTAIKDLDVWLTASPTGAVTWATPPAENRLLGSVTSTSPGCPSQYAEVDGGTMVQDALDAHLTSLTVEVRVPAADEQNPSYAAHLDPNAVRLLVESDGAPSVIQSASLTQGMACTTTWAPWTWTLTPQLAAQYADPDNGDQATSGWAIWPTGHPDQKTTYPGTGYFSGNNYFTVPAGLLQENVSYSWATQVTDGELTSAWSTPCRFRVDQTAPAAPVVTSPDLDPTGIAPAGRKIRFDLSSPSSDVTLYQWSWFGQDFPVILPGSTDPNSVRPKTIGGPVTVALNMPDTFFAPLYIRTIDRAGNPSPAVQVNVYQQTAYPIVSWVSGVPKAGGTSVVRFTPDPLAGHVTSYEWTMNYGTTYQQVKAKADGTAQVRVTWPDQPGFPAVQARSISANGYLSSTGTLTEDTYGPVWIHSADYPSYANSGGVGVPGTFVFYNRDPAAKSAVYQFDSDAPVTVPFVNGRATVTYTPTVAGDHFLTVDTIEKAGPTGAPASYGFGVAGP